MGERQLAGIIDAAFLLFACGGFLALFGSLGGHFTLSKLNAAVCMTALAVVYLQYFALFTVFGGTTPGMMFRGLQVMSFSGESPTPRQMLMRSAGYMLSAGTCFLGFFWALWDEDQLTWHDRFSRTFLSSAQTYAEIETHTAAPPALNRDGRARADVLRGVGFANPNFWCGFLTTASSEAIFPSRM